MAPATTAPSRKPQRPSDEVYDQSVIDDRAPSVARMLLDRVQATPRSESFRFAEGESWTSRTWQQTYDEVATVAAGLVALGVEPEQRVALACSTRYEWIVADLAVMCAAAATTTVYPTTGADDVAYIVADSQSRVVIAEDPTQLAKLRDKRADLPDLATVVLLDGAPGADDGEWVITWAELVEKGRARLQEQPDLIEERVAGIGPDDLATLIYTSGTTGRPKGVRLLHKSWTYVAAGVDAAKLLAPDDLQYLWLPLAHSFGKMLICLPLQIGFATAVDGRIDKIVDNLAVVKPTFMGAAPRIFEKAYGRITTMVAGEGGIRAKLFGWATGVAKQVATARLEGRGVPPHVAVQHKLADALVLSKVRARFGGNLRFFISGSAALNQDVARWFYGAGVLILEGYGLTETSAASFVNRPDAYRFGTVGWPIPGTELEIASDGEILVRGPGVMQGYHNLPDATAEALDGDGWLHTGDIGEVDDRGFLRITDRKKDLFKTSGGKYVAPSAIEAMFKGICPYASQLVVHGEERNFVSALITLDAEAMEGWAAEHGRKGASYADLVTSDEVRAMVQGYVDELNEKLNRWETVKKFVILERDLTVEEGELTPSLKLRRKVVTDRFRSELDALYA